MPAAVNSLKNGIANSPIILAQSATPVSVTGTLTETTLATITIPGGMMGPNGSLRITPLFSYTSSANNKQLRVKFGGAAYLSIGATTSATTQQLTLIRNRGSAASQVAMAASASVGSSSNSPVTTTVDTTAETTIVITGQLANTGETITLEGYAVEVLPS